MRGSIDLFKLCKIETINSIYNNVLLAGPSQAGGTGAPPKFYCTIYWFYSGPAEALRQRRFLPQDFFAAKI